MLEEAFHLDIPLHRLSETGNYVLLSEVIIYERLPAQIKGNEIIKKKIKFNYLTYKNATYLK